MKRLALLAFVLSATPAYADVVDPAPDDCPEGSTGDTCHGGPHCVPVRCTTNEDCEGDFVCEEREYCVGVINCAGMLGPGEDPSDYDRDVIEGDCRGECSGGCNVVRLCVPPLPTGDGGGGCSAGGAPTGGLLLLLSFAMVFRGRRRG